MYMADFPELNAADRADIVCRVFEQKIKLFVAFMKKTKIFGQVTRVLDTVEFQKRGLPHCHTLLWVDSESKIRSPEDVDRFILAELPDPSVDPQGYKIVSEMMMHGPCGPANPSATCTQGDKCNKIFPKTFTPQTFFDNKGRVHYKRRDDGVSETKHQLRILRLKHDDKVSVQVYFKRNRQNICSSVYPLVNKPLQVAPQDLLEPVAQILSVHLQNMQRLTFRDTNTLQSVVNLPRKKNTTLTEWFAYNTANVDGRHLTYLDFPSEFVWYPDRKSWSPRRNSKSSIGRLEYVHPTSGELLYFRMLLCHQTGCKDFFEVQIVNKVFYPTCRYACQALGLLGDDVEWDTAFQEACVSATSIELRSLFAQILVHCDVTDPFKLWTNFWNDMSHDIPDRVLEMSHIPNYHVNDFNLQGYVLYEIQLILNNCNKSLADFGLPSPPTGLIAQLENRMLMEERNYNREELMLERCNSVPKLNSKQRRIYDMVIRADSTNEQELIFVYGHGGTGKTFMWKTIISTLRSEGKIVLAVASSGIASLLLPSGRTTHSRFISKLLADTNLIVWDEAPMNDRRCFESMDKSLRDILDASHSLFGGKSVLLGGDFRQTLPVKKDINANEHSLVTLFASWLLDIGDGNIGDADEQDPENNNWISIPFEYCFPSGENGLSSLIDFIYDQNTLQTPSAVTLQQKAIVCPKNETADVINSKVLEMVQGESTTYLSQDEATPLGDNRADTEMTTSRMDLCTIAQLTPSSVNKTFEAKVYKKWIAKSPPQMKPYAFCCILLDQEGNAIQGKMALKDAEYFNEKL
ncbi:DNA helicase [Tanacetum coccineum]